MSGKTPLELAKQFNEAGHRGDIEDALSLIAEDVMVTDLGAPLDAPRVHRGRHELLSYYARFAQDFENFDREVEEWVEAGDWVIAVGRWVGTGKGSGARVEARTASASRFRDGKVVETILGFPSKEAALEAIRLREQTMSQENVEIVRRFLHAFVQGDYEASTEHIDAEVVLWSDPRANLETQQVRGRGAVTASIGRFVSSFDDYWCAEPDELIDAGDWVVVVMRSGGRGRSSGVAVTQTWNVAYELAEGKVVRIEFHPSREDALKAVGLSE